ncbi:MAG TPA: RDD family protein [Ignavibacteriales bacterium]|nr:RDD family protein [Ignavibacteriales bacterium]
MQKIQIETTQNVMVEYEIAGVGRRIAASLIDLLIISGYAIAESMLSSVIRESAPGLNIYLFLLLILPVIFYDLLCETLMDGQSFGKKGMDIKVVKLDGGQPTFISYFLRWILRIIDVMISGGCVAIFSVLINSKGQRLGDLAANTTVIRVKSDASLEDTILTEINDSYQVKFQEASGLSDKDAGVIKEVIDLWKNTPYEELQDKVALRTKEVIAKKLGITTDMPPLPFLETLLNDYNFISNSSKS